MKVLGIDIGGSAVKGAPVDTTTGQLLSERLKIETPKALTPLAMAKTVASLAQAFQWRGPIGVGFPGVVRGPRVLTSANLHKGFINRDVQALFAKATGCRVALINDADAAGLAEMRLGIGRGEAGSVLLLTLGTGIGSSLFNRGQLVQNTELGHLPIRGRSAERFVSSAARKRRRLDWPAWGRELGGYLQILEEILWPEMIILGGGASAKHKKFLRYVKCRTRVVPAAFHNEAGIVGAAVWGAEAR